MLTVQSYPKKCNAFEAVQLFPSSGIGELNPSKISSSSDSCVSHFEFEGPDSSRDILPSSHLGNSRGIGI